MSHGVTYIEYEAEQETYAETITTQLEFSWICPRCHYLGYMHYDAFKFYKGVVECPQCEMPWRLKEPWR